MKYFPRYQVGQEVKVANENNSNSLYVGEVVTVIEIINGENEKGEYYETYTIKRNSASYEGDMWYIVDHSQLTSIN